MSAAVRTGSGGRRDPRRPLAARLVVMVLAWTSSGQAELHGQQALPLDVTPDSVAIPVEGAAPVVVTVTNTGAQSLTDLRLSAFSAEPFNIEIDSMALAELGPGDMHAWTATLRDSTRSTVAGSIHFRLDYLQGRSGASPLRRVSLVELKARARGVPDPNSVVEVQVQTSLQYLTEQRPGLVHLVIENKHDFPIEVGVVEATGPSFVEFVRDSTGLTIAPDQSESVTIEARAADRVQPGNQVMLFRIPIEWEELGVRHSASLIVSHAVDVGVFGESEILGILGTVGVGIPSLLLLPGFLILITLWVLWRVGVLRHGYERPALVAEGTAVVKMPEFWAAAITLSLLMAVVYPLLPGGRSYLESYGLRDIVNVWMISVFAIGIGGYVLVMAVVRWQAWRRAQEGAEAAAEQARKTPAPTDDEMVTLAKLGRRSLPLRRPHWTIEDGGQSGRVYVVDSDENADPVWVTPAIDLTYQPSLDQAGQAAIEQHLRDDSDPEELRDALAPAVEAGTVRVAFRVVGSLTGPRQVARSRLSAAGNSRIAQRV